MIITQTPMRISFAGGGTDLPEVYGQIGKGIVVSSTINKFVFVLVNRRQDNLTKVSYSKIEVVSDINAIQHNIVRECLRLFRINGGLDISYSADLPINTTGSGLGSSSALTVGIILALATYVGDESYSDLEKLAESAFRLESETLKHPVGKQDHYAAAVGGFNKFRFSNEATTYESLQVNTDFMQDLEGNLHLFYTGLDRISSSILSSQKAQLPTTIDHYEILNKLATDLFSGVEQNSLNNFGQLLTQGWIIKKTLAAGVSNSKIDKWLEKAITAGAEGGKICGAGGGGFLLLYIQKTSLPDVKNALIELQHEKVSFSPLGSRVMKVFVNDEK